MKVDVSEIKTFKACKRQWQLSSRNRFHLRPKITPKAFAMGTLFHESLAELYLGVSLDRVMDMVKKEITDDERALLAMIPGYATNVLPDDLDRYKVLDIEHHFEFKPFASNGELLFPELDLVVCGSIDMIVLDIYENKIYGFEHKTCKDFRDPSFMWMDEQPRVYTLALMKYVAEYNERKYNEWLDACEVAESNSLGDTTAPEQPTPVELGGIYMNEVRKLLRQFQYNRTLCTYSNEDMDNFMHSFFTACLSCHNMVETDSYAAPSPSYFACKMCNFKSVCATYMYESLDKDKIVKEFEEELVERTEDHLEEKTERKA